MLLVAKRVFGPKNLWIFFLCCFATNCLAQVAGVALYLQYAPPGAPPPAPLTPPVPVTNFIANSSFEIGAGRGWIVYGSGGNTRRGNESSPEGRLTNGAVHGNVCMAGNTRFLSQSMYLTTSVYNVSFYLKGDLGGFNAFWTNVASPRYEEDPGIPIPITTSWVRHGYIWNCPSNGYYSLKLATGVNGQRLYVDAVQLTPGPTLTPYTPTMPVEFGISTADINSILMAGDTKQFELNFWNDTGTNTTASVSYVVHDTWNSNLLSATFTTNALAPGATTVNVTLPAYNGWLRVMANQPSVNDSWEEHPMAVLPYAVNMAMNTNGVLGSTPEWSPYSLLRDRRLGFTTSRDLSAACVRWSSVQPTSAPIIWGDADNCIGTFSTYNTLPLLVLLPGTSNDGEWQPWALNGSGQADINLYSNYCWQVANRYFPSNCFYYEIGNEWHNFRPPLCPTDFLGDVVGSANAASNRARFMVAGAIAVSNATAGAATIVGLAGENLASRGLETWNWMTAGEKLLFHVLSAHLYPNNQGDVDPNISEDDIGNSQSTLSWRALFGSVRPLYNSEMGNQGNRGGYLGQRGFFHQGYQNYGFISPEAGRDWGMGQRKVVPVFRESRQVIRCLGNGFKKVIGYTSKAFGEDIWWGDRYMGGNAELNGAPRQGTVAQLISANYFIRNPGLGRLTNTATGTFTEAYLFTNVLGTVVGMWSGDYLERTLTTGDGRFASYDVMGNLVATNTVAFRIGRTPTFLVSGSLTTAQLSNAVVTASAALLPDTTGPNISIDMSAVGMIPAGQTNFFKWTVTDRNKQAWGIGNWPANTPNTNNLSWVKFASADTWIYVGESNHFRQAFSVTTTNRLYVRAKDHYNNFTTNSGPVFSTY